MAATRGLWRRGKENIEKSCLKVNRSLLWILSIHDSLNDCTASWLSKRGKWESLGTLQDTLVPLASLGSRRLIWEHSGQNAEHEYSFDFINQLAWLYLCLSSCLTSILITYSKEVCWNCELCLTVSGMVSEDEFQTCNLKCLKQNTDENLYHIADILKENLLNAKYLS